MLHKDDRPTANMALYEILSKNSIEVFLVIKIMRTYKISRNRMNN